MRTVLEGAARVINQDDITVSNISINGLLVLWRVQNVTLKNIDVHGGHSGIILYDCQNCKIEACNIHDIPTWAGIYLILSSNNIILGNTVKDVKVTGIYMEAGSNNNIVEDNHVSLCGYGIECFFSSDNTISNNRIDNNNTGTPEFGGHGVLLQCHSKNNRVFLNHITRQKIGALICYTSNEGVMETNTFNDCAINISQGKNSYTYMAKNQLSAKNTVWKAADHIFGIWRKPWKRGPSSG